MWTVSKEAPVEQQFFRVREVAEILGISRASAYALVKRGEIPSVEVAGTIRVHRADTEGYIQQLLESTAAKASVGTH